MLNSYDRDYLMELAPRTIDGSQCIGYEQLVRNNSDADQTKFIRRKIIPRTGPQVRSDSAAGLGFEQYLSDTGLFIPNGTIKPKNWKQRKDKQEIEQDLFYCSERVQAKTFRKFASHGDGVFFSEAQFNSIQSSLAYNDFYIFGIVKPEGDRDSGSTLYTYRMGFAASSQAVAQYLRPNQGSPILELGWDMRKRGEKHFQPLCPELIEDTEI